MNNYCHGECSIELGIEEMLVLTFSDNPCQRFQCLHQGDADFQLFRCIGYGSKYLSGICPLQEVRQRGDANRPGWLFLLAMYGLRGKPFS